MSETGDPGISMTAYGAKRKLILDIPSFRFLPPNRTPTTAETSTVIGWKPDDRARIAQQRMRRLSADAL